MKIRWNYLAATALLMVAVTELHGVTVTEQPWGQDAHRTAVDLYTLKDASAEVQVTTYGARIMSIRVPNRAGILNNVVLGFSTLDGYLEPRNSVMGATIGRFANRIAGGTFHLDGKAYEVSRNNNGNSLHGGTVGFDQKVWTAKRIADGVVMTLVSPDGDMGFPGDLTVSVAFTLLKQHGAPALRIAYTAKTNRTTVVNLTNHAYFNLADDPSTPVFSDIARIDADSYTPVNATGIPTGTTKPVEGTPFDFRKDQSVGTSIPDRGYDQNFVLHSHKTSEPVAEVYDPASGRAIQVFTDQPGLQLFVPKSPPPTPSTNSAPRRSTEAFCLETQHFPDSPNQPTFPTTTLLPGRQFHSSTTYVFTVLTR